MERLNGIKFRSRIILGLQTFLKRVGFAVLFCVQVALGQWTEPVLMRPPINVDPPGSYYYSTISADGQVLCMTIETSQGFGDDDVYISERIDDSTWTTPVNAGPNVNHAGRNLSPSITSDRQRLYYVSYNAGSYDFFVSYRTGPDWDDWSPGEQLPEPINRGREFTGQISFDDSTLVFTSTGQPGMHEGGDAAFTSRLQPNGSWSEPEEIAYHLYDPAGFLHPCLSQDNELFVYGQWWGSNLEILYSVRTDTGFGPAIRCDSTINTEWWDSGPSCPADGSVLIFESLRVSEGGGAHRLFQARRVFSSAFEQNQESNPPNTMRISPTFGSLGTPFEITLPTSMEGSTLHIHNILGQEIESIVPTNYWQTNYTWKGQRNGSATSLSSGLYFIQARNKTQTAVGKVLLLR